MSEILEGMSTKALTAAKFKAFLTKNDLTPIKAAGMIPCAPSTIYDWFSGRREPHGNTLVILQLFMERIEPKAVSQDGKVAV